MLFKPQYPISMKLKKLLKNNNLTRDDLNQARILLDELVANDERKPYTKEHSCAFEVVIYLHENKPNKAFEIADKLANSPSTDLFTLQSQINLMCYDCGFKKEWNRLFTRR